MLPAAVGRNLISGQHLKPVLWPRAPQTGTFTDTLKFSNGTSMKFKARVPMSLPKEKTLGLILAFHPHGGNENSMVDWPSKTFWSVKGLWMNT